MSITPHAAFEIVTPDQVAECWDGVYGSGDLYERLWSCVDSYEDFDREDCGPADVIGCNSVAGYWNRFSPEHQARLNELAEARDAEIAAMMAGVR